MSKKKYIFLFIITILSPILLSDCRQEIKILPADTIYMNGYVYTVDKIRSVAEAIAIKNGKFCYIGTDSGITNYIGPNTKIIDLSGKMVLPGFIDSHTHAISGAKQLFEVDLYNLKSIPEIQNAIKIFYLKNPNKKFIKGRGWSNTLFGKTGPDKKYIDHIVNNIPVSLQSEDGHSIWVNSKALEMANITEVTPDPQRGVIERYPKTNQPNGTLREKASDLVSYLFPYYSKEELMAGLEYFQKMVNSFGITTIHDAYIDIDSVEIPAYKKLEEENRLSMRVRASLYIDPSKDKEQVKNLLYVRSKNQGPLFQTNNAKIFVDGVVEGSTAYLNEPYDHIPNFKGDLLWNIDKLYEICAELDRNNFQIHIHSIGDGATRIILDAFEYAEIKNGKRDSRNMITHLQLVNQKDIKRFNELGIVAVTQPFWFKKDSYYYNIQIPYLGQKRADKEYPMKSFFDSGVTVASSSDYPVTKPCNPLIAIQTGITRSELDNNDSNEVLWKEERVSLDQMIASFTINGAYAIFLEDLTGSIELNKYADMIILDNNLLKIPVNEISKTKVLITIFEGREVFKDPNYN